MKFSIRDFLSKYDQTRSFLKIWLHLLNGKFHFLAVIVPVHIFMFKVRNRNTKKRGDICSKLTINVPEQRH